MGSENRISPEEHLYQLREKWLLSDQAKQVLKGELISDVSEVSLHNKLWEKRIFSDQSGDRKFIVFELSRKKFLHSEHFCLGCEVVGNKFNLVDKQQLWQQGIP